jgi:hypothetical protein
VLRKSFKVRNLDGHAMRVFRDDTDVIVERLERLCAVEGWDEVVVDGNAYSILGSNLVSVATKIQRAIRRAAAR